jgi:hypothetical protein
MDWLWAHDIRQNSVWTAKLLSFFQGQRFQPRITDQRRLRGTPVSFIAKGYQSLHTWWNHHIFGAAEAWGT